MSTTHAVPVAPVRDPAMPWIIERSYVRLVRLVNRMFPGPDRIGDPLDDDARALAASRPPVVLVYGMGCSACTWDPWRRSLVDDGFTVHVVELPRNNMGSARDAARSLARDVAAIRAAHGSDQVQLVGFSFGGIVSRTFLHFMDGWGEVERLVTVATPHHGSIVAPSARRRARSPIAHRLNEATLEIAPDSELMGSLARAWDPDTDGPRCTSIHAPAFDGFVAPWTSSRLPGATNVAVPGRRVLRASWRVNHHTIVTRDANAYAAARRALLGR